MIKIKMKLFGAFEKYTPSENPLFLYSEQPINLISVKELLKIRLTKTCPNFCESELIEDSAIADESTVFLSDHIITESCTLFVLPPVCGG